MTAPVAAAPAPAAAPAANTTQTATPAPATGATDSTPTPEALHEITISGEARKVPLKELIRLAQKGGFADQTVRQAKEALKEFQAWKAERAAREAKEKEDADELLRSRGHDPDALALKKLQAKLREQEMTPEQREAQKERDRAEAAEKKLKDMEAEREQQKLSEQTAALQRRMEADLAAAADRAGMPRDSETFYAVYEVAKEWLANWPNYVGTYPDDAGYR